MSDLGWFQRTWHDNKQNERLDSLSSQLESQRSEARRLTARLSNVQGNLDHRLSRLTKAFDAFVELSDLREELRAFQPETAARRHARRVVLALVARGDATGPPALPGTAGLASASASETPGYWLPPAVAGLLAIVRHDGATAATELAVARDCDATRTDLFVCLALVLSRRGDEATDLLPGLLDLRPDQLDQPVTRAQRELWLAACRGRFGAPGRAVVGDRLAALVAGLPDEQRSAKAEAWRDLVNALDVTLPATSAFPRLPSELLAPIRAARQLAALADWYERAVAGPDALPETVPAEPGQDEALASLLQELVDEGAPDEWELLDRAAELRSAITGSSPAASPWHGPVDPSSRPAVLVLLLADARSDDPDRRAMAAIAAGPLLAEVADDLATAAARPAPQQTEVQVGRHVIRYRSMGVDPATVAAAQAATLAAPTSPAGRTARIGWALVAAAVLVALVGSAAGAAAFAVTLGVALGGLGAWLLVEARRTTSIMQDEERRRRNEWTRLEQQITAIEAAAADLRKQADHAPAEARTARSHLATHLTTAAHHPRHLSPS